MRRNIQYIPRPSPESICAGRRYDDASSRTRQLDHGRDERSWVFDVFNHLKRAHDIEALTAVSGQNASIDIQEFKTPAARRENGGRIRFNSRVGFASSAVVK